MKQKTKLFFTLLTFIIGCTFNLSAGQNSPHFAELANRIQILKKAGESAAIGYYASKGDIKKLIDRYEALIGDLNGFHELNKEALRIEGSILDDLKLQLVASKLMRNIDYYSASTIDDANSLMNEVEADIAKLNRP